MKPLSELMIELQTAKDELNNTYCPKITDGDIEDVSDIYQARLEYNWWRAEQMELIESLTKEISDYIDK